MDPHHQDFCGVWIPRCPTSKYLDYKCQTQQSQGLVLSDTLNFRYVLHFPQHEIQYKTIAVKFVLVIGLDYALPKIVCDRY